MWTAAALFSLITGSAGCWPGGNWLVRPLGSQAAPARPADVETPADMGPADQLPPDARPIGFDPPPAASGGNTEDGRPAAPAPVAAQPVAAPPAKDPAPVVPSNLSPESYGDGWRPHRDSDEGQGNTKKSSVVSPPASAIRLAAYTASERPQDKPDTLPDLPERGGGPAPVRDSSPGPKGEPGPRGKADPFLDAPPFSGATPIIPEPVQEYPVDLPAALARAGVENPTIAIAQAEIRVALAAQLEARALLLPNLNAGTNYHFHEGSLLASFGGMRRTNGEQSLYFGFGARTIAAETIAIPGLQLIAPLANGIFNPIAARDEVVARRYAATATRNNILLDVSMAYLDLVAAEGRLEVIRLSEKNVEQVVNLTIEHYRSGLGRRGDADRALSEAALFHRDEQQAEEEVAVAAARLAELLNLDPSVRLRTQDGPVQLFDIVNLNDPLEELIQIAVRNRPEMGQWGATIAAAEVRLRQEQVRPFLPTFLLGFSAGGFGGGANQQGYHMGKFGGRTDFDALAFWTFQNFGFGNLANARRRRAEVGEAEAERVTALNLIRDQVAEALATARARLRDVDVARRQLATAQDGFRRDMEAARGLIPPERLGGEGRLPGPPGKRPGLGVGPGEARGGARPIEVLQSARLLAAARQELLMAIIRYDEAQFRLFVALGQPPDLAGPGGGKAGCR